MADTPRPSRTPGGTQAGQPGGADAHTRPRWVTVAMVIGVALVLAFVVLHLAGGGMGSHG